VLFYSLILSRCLLFVVQNVQASQKAAAQQFSTKTSGDVSSSHPCKEVWKTTLALHLEAERGATQMMSRIRPAAGPAAGLCTDLWWICFCQELIDTLYVNRPMQSLTMETCMNQWLSLPASFLRKNLRVPFLSSFH